MFSASRMGQPTKSVILSPTRALQSFHCYITAAICSGSGDAASAGSQVIAAPRRLQILGMVWEQELSAGEIARQFDVTWGAVSQHITTLRTAGYLIERRDGKGRYYSADKEALGVLRIVVEEHWRASLNR